MTRIARLLASALIAATVVAVPTQAEAHVTYTRYMGTTTYWYPGDAVASCYTTSTRYTTSTGTSVCGTQQSTVSQGFVMVRYPGHTRACFKRRFSYGFVTTGGASYFTWTTNLYSVC